MGKNRDPREARGIAEASNSVAPTTDRVNGVCDCEACILSRLVTRLSLALDGMRRDRDRLRDALERMVDAFDVGQRAGNTSAIAVGRRAMRPYTGGD